nr:sodium:proton exchanger [Polyangiaceae bacterium]
LLHAVGQTSALVFVVFFAAAGAHLDLPLLKQLWPLAVGLCVIRAAATVLAHRLACRSAKEQGPVRSYGASGLISQAGLTLGIAIVVERQFPSFGAGLRSLAIATVAINEIAGPVLFKLALDRSHESAASTEPELEPAQA